MAFERYYNAVRFLEGLSNVPGKLYMNDRNDASIYLRRMRYFLELLGNPDYGMKFIHITGTAGKGTVAYMIQNILSRTFGNTEGTECPRGTGLFNSPFVTTTIEKIRVDDQYIAPDEFADIVEQIKPAIDKAYAEGPYGGPSYFEIIVAIALLYFKKRQCEWVVWEVGLGGRYDGTNVIEHPVVTAITNIDYDHTHILGKTLTKIAYDKAGIIKKDAVFFTTERRPRLLKMFQKICAEVGAICNSVASQGEYNDRNIALVTAIAKQLGAADNDIAVGIAETRLPCRFEEMQKNPLIILDGAHNPIKIASTVSNLSKREYRKLLLVIGMADDKDGEGIIEQLAPLADSIFVTRFEIKERKCEHPKTISALIGVHKKSTATVELFMDPYRALDAARKHARKDDCILVTGSFFLAGELRKIWYQEEWVIQHRKSFK